MKLKSLLYITLLSAVSTWYGCTEPVYSRKFPCRFVLDEKYHTPCKLITAVSSPAYPVKVSVNRNVNGSYQVEMTDRNGTERQNLTTQVETYAYSGGIYLGANNSIIVCSDSYDFKPVAYDGQCPNCINELGGNNHPLQFSAQVMQVVCNTCHRVYDLNNGNIISGGQGDRLMQYPVNRDQSRGIIRIGN